MSLFHKKTAEEKQLELLLNELQINMANNYKDNAVSGFRKLSEEFRKMKEEKRLSEKAADRYEKIITEYQAKLVGYGHNDQKPYWTKEDPSHEKR